MYSGARKNRGKKKAVCAGLFLGMWLSFGGCVTQPAGTEHTNTPGPTGTGNIQQTPEPMTATPVPPVTEAVVKPTVVPTVGPTEIPEMTPPVSTAPTEIPKNTPEITPESTPTPPLQEGTVTEAPSATPVVTPEITPEPTKTPAPLPTAVPEYDTLLQNSWQRTEDFFRCREIFFSGKFDDAEAVVGDGTYEFSYRAISDVSVLLRIIGEEDKTVQPLLDELRKKWPECVITEEGPEDYSYVYVDGKTQVSGRVYACRDGVREHRMRIEFYCLSGVDMQTEGYGFYLR